MADKLKKDMKKKKRPFYDPDRGRDYKADATAPFRSAADVMTSESTYPLYQATRATATAPFKAMGAVKDHMTKSTFDKMSPEEKKKFIESQTEVEAGKDALKYGPKERLEDKALVNDELAKAAKTAGIGSEEDKDFTQAPSPDKYYKPLISEFEKRLDEIPEAEASTWEEEVKATREWAAKAKETLDKRELAETLTQALTQLAAGWYGLKHGMDLSGIEFNKQNWQAELADLRQQEASKLSESDKREAQRARRESSLESTKARIQSGLDSLKGRLQGERYGAAVDTWRSQLKARKDKLKSLMGGTSTTADIKKALDESQQRNKIYTDAIKAARDGDEDEARTLLQQLQTKETVDKVGDTSWWDLTSDEESMIEFAEKAMDQERKQAKILEMGLQASAEGKAIIQIPEFAEQGKPTVVAVPKTMIEDFKAKYPKTRVIINAGKGSAE